MASESKAPLSSGGFLRESERKAGNAADSVASKEQLEVLIEKTERMADRLGDFILFRKIRHMGKLSRRFFVLVIASAVVLYWRGVWELYDLFWEYVLPNNRITGAVISMVIGAAILVGTGKLVDALGPVEVDIHEEIDVVQQKGGANAKPVSVSMTAAFKKPN